MGGAAWWLTAIFAAAGAGVVVLAFVAHWMVTDTRNYHPLLRVLFLALSGAYGGLASATLLGTANDPRLRALASTTVCVAMAYCVWFVRKRNRTKRWVRVTAGGHIEFRPVEEMEQITLLAISYAEHGDMPADLMARMREALDEGERKQRWAANLQAGVDERRARRADSAGGGEGER
jgi:uncharacterized membrane protein